MTDQNLGSLLHDARRHAGLSQAELASRAGVSNPTVRLAERSQGTIGTYLKLVTASDHTFRIARVADPGLMGGHLADVRRRKRMTQRAASKASSLSLPTVVNLEKRFSGRLALLEAYLALLERKPSLTPNRREEPESRRRRLAPKTNNPSKDIVMTPPRLAEAIVGYFKPTGIVLDPCRGDGAFFNAFPNHVEAEWCEIPRGPGFHGMGASRKLGHKQPALEPPTAVPGEGDADGGQHRVSVRVDPLLNQSPGHRDAGSWLRNALVRSLPGAAGRLAEEWISTWGRPYPTRMARTMRVHRPHRSVASHGRDRGPKSGSVITRVGHRPLTTPGSDARPRTWHCSRTLREPSRFSRWFPGEVSRSNIFQPSLPSL